MDLVASFPHEIFLKILKKMTAAKNPVTQVLKHLQEIEEFYIKAAKEIVLKTGNV